MNTNEAVELPDINADLTRRVAVDTETVTWKPSPSATVWRKPLYRQGGEFGAATSLVRYAPGGAFRSHARPRGEEILVLDGVFADDHGEYPAGAYLLNPDGGRHAPRSDTGCTLFVRLRQYAGRNRLRLVLDTTAPDWQPGPRAGLSVKPLYAQAGYPERMSLVRWAPGAGSRRHVPAGGEEILVLDGELRDDHGIYRRGCWLRIPPLGSHAPYSETGCLLYVRVGGL